MGANSAIKTRDGTPHYPKTLTHQVNKKKGDMMSGLIMKYFVLKPRGSDPYAKASRGAMRSYAAAIHATDPEMADALYAWADSEAKAGAHAVIDDIDAYLSEFEGPGRPLSTCPTCGELNDDDPPGPCFNCQFDEKMGKDD
jgi:hypothetical protein